MNRIIPIFGCILVFVTPVLAQNGGSIPPVPQITVVGHGEIKVTPDRATVQISVQSRATTAAGAAADNAKKQSAVIASIRALGIKAEEMSTSNYSVTPEQKYEANRAPVVTGYVVTNTVVVEVRNISQVGAVLDAALAHGANLISGLDFSSSNSEAARRSAIAVAVTTARADAEAAARAAGGSLGALLELSVNSYSPPGPRPMMMRAMASASMQTDTPISAGQETLAVDVSTRWRFIPPM